MSDTQKWTPEPWYVGCDSAMRFTGPIQIVGTNSFGDKFVVGGFNSNFENLSRANCARAVACVNAMAGIADPAEYRKNADKLFSEIVRMDQEHATLTRERDDLNQLVADLTEAKEKKGRLLHANEYYERLDALTRERDALREQVKVLRDEVRAWRGREPQHRTEYLGGPCDCKKCLAIRSARAATDAAGVKVKP